MKKLTILLTATLLTACSFTTGTYNGRTYTFDTPVKTIADREAKAKAMYEAEVAEQERITAEKAKLEAEAKERAEQAAKAAQEKAAKEKQAKIKAAFDKAYPKLLNGKCSTDKWNSYEFGHYFASLASKNKITPWKVIKGTSYERRNILRYEYNEALDNYFTFQVYHMPDDIKTYYDEQDETKQASIFNAIIKKYNACYQQLK